MSKVAIKAPSNDLYETDFYAWTQEQAKLLREKRWDDLDLDNLVEEVECVGRRERHQIESRLVILVGHLLKWKYQAGRRGDSWTETIFEQRVRIASIIEDSPSVTSYPAKALERRYRGARLLASKETGIAFDLFPEECPFTIEQILDPNFFPEEPGHIGAGNS